MSAPALNTAERVTLLLSLVPYLLDHGPTPITELANTFSVSPAVLRELVGFLGTAGVPGETQTYQHEDLFDLDWGALEERDEVSLTRWVAVDDTPRFSGAETAALLAGLHYLSGVLPAEQQDSIRYLTNTLSRVGQAGAPAITVTADPLSPILSLLTDAVQSQKRVQFRYRDARGEISVRTVDPWTVLQSEPEWYLRGWCALREEGRLFRVDRMSDLEITADPSQHPKPPASPQTEALLQPGYDMAVDTLLVTLSVHNEALDRFSAYRPESITPSEQQTGWSEVVIRLVHHGVIPRLLALAPGSVRVLAPDTAVAAARRWLEQALANYDA